MKLNENCEEGSSDGNRSDVPAFSVKDFCQKLLNVDEDVIEYMQTFIKGSKDSSKADVVLEFLTEWSTSDASQLTGLLMTRRPSEEIVVVFNCLEVVFLRISGDLRQYESWATAVVKQLMQTGMVHVFDSGLRGGDGHRKMATLRLLTSMVTSGATAAKEVAANVKLEQRTLRQLLSAANRTAVDSVRTCTIYFLMSFLMTGDSQLIRYVIFNRGFTFAFSLLHKDKMATIEIFLRTLLSKVVNNQSISKKIKVRIFGSDVLAGVLRLFQWRESTGKAGVDRETARGREELVRRMAYEFAETVCCSPDRETSVVFPDDHSGMKNANPEIEKLLSRYSKPYGDPLLEDFFVSIFKAVPGQIARFLPVIRSHLKVEPTDDFVRAVSFVRKIFVSQDPVGALASASHGQSAKAVAAITMKAVTTPLLDRNILADMLGHKNAIVRHQGVLFVGTVLEKASRLVDENDPLLKSVFLRPEDLCDFAKEFKKQLMSVLTPFGCLAECLNLAISKGNSMEIGADDRSLNEVVGEAEHVAAIVAAIGNFSRIDGNLVREKINAFSDDLFEVLSRDESAAENATKIRLSVLSLLSDSDVGKALLARTVLDKSVASIVCDAIAGASDSSAIRLLKTLLLRTGQFEAVEREVNIWVEHLIACSSTDPTDIVDFFADVVVRLVRDVDVLTAAQKELCLNAVGSSTVEEQTLCDRVFDEIFFEEDDDRTDVEFVSSFEIQPFSLMVLSALHALQCAELAPGDRCSEFLSSILEDVIHTQQDVTVLCYVLKRHEHVLPKRFAKYVASLDPSNSQEDWIVRTPSRKKSRTAEVVDRKGVTALLRQIFQQRRLQSIECNVSEDVWYGLSDGDVASVVQQALVYLKVLTGKRSPLQLVAFFCDFLQAILERDWSFRDTAGLIGGLILNHRVVRDCFLHDALLSNGDDSDLMQKVTELAYEAVPYVPDLNRFPHLINSAPEFVLKKLQLMKGGRGSASRTGPTSSLVHILDPFKEMLSAETLRLLVVRLCEFTALEMLDEARMALSPIGRLLACVLMAVSSKHLEGVDHILTVTQAAGVARLYEAVSTLVPLDETEQIDSQLSVLGSGLLDVLDSSPLYGLAVDRDFFEYCLKCKTAIDRKILDVTLRSNVSKFVRLEEWLLESDALQSEPLGYAKIVLTFLRFHSTSDTATAFRGKKTERLFVVITRCYWPLIVGKLLRLEEISKDDDLDATTATAMVGFLLRLEPAVVSLEQKMEFCRRAEELAESDCVLSTNSSKVLCDVLTSISEEEHGDGKPSPIVTLVKICLRCLQTLGNANIVEWKRVASTVWFLSNVLKQNERLPGLMKTMKESKLWKPFVKAAVEWAMRDARNAMVLELIHNLLQTLHSSGELKRSRVSKVFEAIFGHPNFVSGVLDTSYSNQNWKARLVDLLLFLVKSNPLLCQPSHVTIYLASYEPLLRYCDVRILQLLHHYERHGISLRQYRPIVWGQCAVNYYSVCDRTGPHVLPRRPQTAEILGLLDKRTMLRTAESFPLALKLNDDGDWKGNGFEKGLYDPRFLLPLLGSLLSTRALVRATTFIEYNSLQLAFASLGSADGDMRAAGYYVLTSVYRHLENNKFRGRHLWLYLLDVVRNALTAPNTRLPSIITAFLVKVCGFIQNPTKAAAVPIMNFLFAKPILDVHNVPEFYIMFSSSDVKHQNFRMWILDLLEEGLRTPADVELCRNRSVVNIVLGYFDSQLASQTCKMKILRVLGSALKIGRTAVQTLERYGVVAFLQTVVRNSGGDEDTIAEVIRILHCSWHAVADEFDEQHQFCSKAKRSADITSLLAQFQLVLLSVLDRLSHKVALPVFDEYVSTLSSVLRFAATLDTEECFAAPGPTTLSLKKLLMIYGRVVGKDRRCDSTNLHSDSIERCEEAVCNIVTSWNCGPPRPIGPTAAVNDNLLNREDYVEVLASSVERLLRVVQPCWKSHSKLIRVYSWFLSHLKKDTSGAVTGRLVSSHEDVVLLLLHNCRYLLKAVAGGSAAFFDEIDSSIVLTRLCLIFVTIGRNLCKGDVPILDAKQGVTRLSWKTFVDLLQRVDVCEVVSALEDSSGHFKRGVAAVSLALLVCESLFEEPTFSLQIIQDFNRVKQLRRKSVSSSTTKRKLERVEETKTSKKRSKLM